MKICGVRVLQKKFILIKRIIEIENIECIQHDVNMGFLLE